jgi:hypothetical protein
MAKIPPEDQPVSNQKVKLLPQGSALGVVNCLTGSVMRGTVQRAAKRLVVRTENGLMIDFAKRLCTYKTGDVATRSLIALVYDGEDAGDVAKTIRKEQHLGILGECVGDEVGLLRFTMPHTKDWYQFARVTEVGKGYVMVGSFRFKKRLADRYDHDDAHVALVWPGEDAQVVAKQARLDGGFGLRGEAVGDMLRVVHVRSGECRACKITTVGQGSMDVQVFDEMFTFRKRRGTGPMAEWALVWPEEEPDRIALSERRAGGFGHTLEELRVLEAARSQPMAASKKKNKPTPYASRPKPRLSGVSAPAKAKP